MELIACLRNFSALAGEVQQSGAPPEIDLLRALVETARVVIIILDPERRIRYANSFFEELSGHALLELEGRDWFDFCVSTPLAGSLDALDQSAVVGHGSDGRIEAIRTKAGNDIIIEWFDRVLRDAKGRATGLLAIGHDATERCNAMRDLQVPRDDLERCVSKRIQELQASEERYRSLVESLDETIFRVRFPDGSYEYMSPSARMTFGYEAATFLENPDQLRQLVCPEYVGDYDEQYTKLSMGAMSVVCEYCICRIDGERRWIRQSNKGIYNHDGELIAAEAICSDISAEHLDRQELATKHQLLEGSFDASTVSLAYLDRDMRFLRVNKAYASADHKDPDYFIGKNHFELFPNEENERIFYAVRDGGLVHTALAKPFEYRDSPERGTSHWDWTLTPVKEQSGHVTGLVLALRDVSARVEAIEAVKDSEIRIRRQLEEKEGLLQEIHHRVKNNLQVISSLLYLQAAQVNDERLTRLLEASRIRVEAMALVHDNLHPNGDIDQVGSGPYLESLASAIYASLGSASTEVSIRVQSTAPPLRADMAVPCGLIACELISNALKHAFRGRRVGQLDISLAVHEENLLRFEVKDDGVGMAMEASQAVPSLGMTLVRALALQINGELQISAGAGMSFRVLFPMAS